MVDETVSFVFGNRIFCEYMNSFLWKSQNQVVSYYTSADHIASDEDIIL